MRETGETKFKACPTPTTLCWKKLKIGSWLQKIKQHCRINFLAIHQWTGVDGIDKLLITKSIAMNFYSYQSTEVGAAAWPRPWGSAGLEAGLHTRSLSPALLAWGTGQVWEWMRSTASSPNSVLAASGRNGNLTGPISTKFAMHPFSRSRYCSLHLSIKMHCRKKGKINFIHSGMS